MSFSLKSIMMKAKAEYILRICGFILITIVVPLTLFTDYSLIDYLLLIIFYFIVIIPWIIFYILSKLTINWIIKRKIIILSALLFLLGLVSIISLFFINYSITLEDYIMWILLLSKTNSLLLCWNFSFSIYRRRKLIFLTSGLSYSVLTGFFLIYSLDILNLMFISLILTFLGMLCILTGELIMIKKGLLNYL